MIELNAQRVQSIWSHSQEVFRSVVVSKADSSFMNEVGWALDLMGIMDHEKFMKQYTTTIFNTIYVPFKIGSGPVSLLSQAILAVHEHTHVFQWEKVGSLAFCSGYLAKKSTRAHWEAEAYMAGLEFEWLLTGQLSNSRTIAEKILNYGCGQAEVAYIETFLDMSIPTVRAGGIISPVVQEIARFISLD